MHRLRSARADEAIEADDLTGVKLERDPVEFGGVGNVIRFEHDRAQLHLPLWIDLTDRATDHEADEIGRVTSAMAPAPTSSPSRRQVQRSATAKDLVELVADEQDRAIAAA